MVSERELQTGPSSETEQVLVVSARGVVAAVVVAVETHRQTLQPQGPTCAVPYKGWRLRMLIRRNKVGAEDQDSSSRRSE